ncbi:sodium:solute symporter [Gordonia sp. OPL2]|uniref:sodium:solute symporter n=1 Tax=Gordonia sp. OPL2 TaxID=2486274 RepID=UPI001655D8F9|nr:sodium:solute symporter [Gordonia sp. OPL2]ROZ99324.1 sodium:solute symporter [Gordonia sp. OPL2]
MDIAIIVVYLSAMLLFGWWGKKKSANSADFLVAGRRLGPALYTGTLCAVVIGGASTVGGVGLGYRYGMAGMWLVVAVATGVLLLSLIFSPRLQKLGIYTVGDMLRLRYGVEGTRASGILMAIYTLMLCVSSTVAYATIFRVLFDLGQAQSVILGGAIVVFYSSVGGMWAITLTDMVQFIVKTIGIFALMLPFTWSRAGGFDGITDRLGDEVFDITSIGWASIVTYFVVYTLGILIGQDVWQRVFTARSPRVARWGGTAAGVYCVLYGIAGAAIGTASAVLIPNAEASDDVYADVAAQILPVGIAGLVLAGAVAAMMSTASGALIATATVCRNDIAPFVKTLLGRPSHGDEIDDTEQDVHGNRVYIIVTGVLAVGLSILINDVVGAITIAYDVLVGGLFVPIVGGLVWKRANGAGAIAAMVGGLIATVTALLLVDDILDVMPVYVGLGTSLFLYVVVSLTTAPTQEPVRQEWKMRSSGRHNGSAMNSNVADTRPTAVES